MVLKILFRLPGPACPEAALTGDAALDDCLRRLDGKLLGSRAVRLLTLGEVKDHLLETRDLLVQRGRSEADACREAVAGMGPVKGYAATQRRKLWRRVLRWVLAFAIWGGIVPAVISSLLRLGTLADAWDPTGLIAGLVAGLAIGYWMAFVSPERTQSRTSEEPGRDDGSFVVARLDPNSTWFVEGRAFGLVTCLVMGVVFVVMGLWCVLGEGPRDAMGYPRWWGIFITGFGLLALLTVPLGLRSDGIAFHVDPDGFWFARGFRRRRRRVAWPDVRAAGTHRDLHPWLHWLLWPSDSSRYVEYMSEEGKAKRLYYSPRWVNADRFLALIDQKLAEQRAACGATSR
jgi:hypothetical protein